MGKTKRVLLVDDFVSYRENIAMVLTLYDYEIDEAGSIEEASVFLENNVYTHYILDYNLPDGLGIDIFRKWRSKMKNKTIMISGKNKRELEYIVLSEGISEVINKPINMSLLKKALKRIKK